MLGERNYTQIHKGTLVLHKNFKYTFEVYFFTDYWEGDIELDERDPFGFLNQVHQRLASGRVHFTTTEG